MSQKKPDRPIQTRFSRPEYEALDNYRRALAEIPPMSETVRTLVNLGLRSLRDDKRTTAKAAE